MCFSSTASFLTAGVAGTIGFVAFSRVETPREYPLAATPLIFGIQQCIEGLLWINLPSEQIGSPSVVSTTLTIVFLLFAKVFWPVYSALAALFIEPHRQRRFLMFLCLAAGIVVSGNMLLEIFSHSHQALIIDDHIVYVSESRPSNFVAAGYLLAVALPLMLSSDRMVIAFGSIVLAGATTAYLAYWGSFASVWCFFAATASAIILFHFEWTGGIFHAGLESFRR
jgi:hypothetical protein